MKILMLNEFYERVGGLEIYLLSLFRALEERGHTVVVIYGIQAKPSAIKENRCSYFVNFSHSIPVVINTLAEIIKKESPDIIHIHELGRAKWIYKYIAKLCAAIPLIQYVQGHGLYCPSGTKSFYNRRHVCPKRYSPYCLWNMLLNRCFESKRPWVSLYNYHLPQAFLENYHIFKKIIVVSQLLKDGLIQQGLKEKDIEVFPYFVDLPEIKKVGDENIILFAGRIYKEKGLDYLIRAAKYINAPFKLLIVGDGKELGNCKKLSRKIGLDGKLRFLGWQSNLSEYYQKASVVVVPAVWPEPLGLVGLEAMSYAKPVVAFNLGGISEWLQDNQTGFLIEPYDVKDMAHKIELLLRDKSLATRLGQQGRWMVESKFNKDRHIDRLLEIYREVKGYR